MLGTLRRSARALVGIALIACLWWPPPLPARAATLTVTNCTDSGVAGDGSLRGEIAAAASGDTITFPAGLTCTITLTNGPLSINKNLTIDAAGAMIAVDGGSIRVTVFTVNSGVTATLNALTIRNGAGLGGGGGILNDGTLTLTNSTLANNSGLYGGGILNEGTLMVTNSTFSGNSASGGGGIFNNGTLTLTNSTLSGNSAGSGGGIGKNLGTVTLTNTIVANSPSGGNCAGIIVADSQTLADDSTCGGAHQATSAQIALQPLANNGGPTATMALGPGSVAIDQGAPVGSGPVGNFVPVSDQRGVPRPINGGVDIGAFEFFSGYTTVVNSIADGAANAFNCATGNANSCRLRDAIAVANAGAGGTTITFAVSGTIRLTSGTLTLAANQTIDGTGATIVVDGGCTGCDPVGGSPPSDGVTVFTVSSGVMAALSGLTIQHGHNVSFGGGILNKGTLTVTDSTLAGDFAGLDGGGIANDHGALTVVGSTLVGNSAFDGGGIANEGGTLTVTNSTLTGNRAILSDGGGIYNHFGTATVTNSTLTGNSAGAGGGGINNSGALTLSNTIVANSASGGDLSGAFTGSNNLIDDATIASLTGTSNVNQPALLGTLGNYGGPTRTIPLLPGSPALDAGNDATCTGTGPGKVNSLDQRGIPRPQGARCDIGAFEARFTLTVSGGNNQTAVVNQPFAAPLAVTVGGPDALGTLSGGIVTFTAPAIGASATFTSANPATTDTSGVARVTATANGTKGAYTVSASTPGATPVQFALTNIAPLVSMTVTPANGTLKVGEVQQYTATGTYADNSTADLTSAVTWSGDAVTIATVDASGKVTGVSPGTARITVTLGGISGQTNATVSAPTPIGVSVPPAPASRSAGTTSQPGATPAPSGSGRGGTPGGTAPAPAPTGR